MAGLVEKMWQPFRPQKKQRPTPKDAPPRDLIIPVMGATGAGKSTYINGLLGKDEMRTDPGFESVTKEIQAASILLSETPLAKQDKYRGHGSRRIVLVDTPGFNDTTLTDFDILKKISSWLENSYRKEETVSGLIFLYEMTQKRMTPIARQNIDIFQKLTGQKALSRVVLGQTSWDELHKDALDLRDVGLRAKYWKPLLDKHARLVRVSRPPTEKAETIRADLWEHIDFILEEALLGISPALRLQKELVDLGKSLEATGAARAIRIVIAPPRAESTAEAQAQSEGDADIAALDAVKKSVLLDKLEEWRSKLSSHARSLLGLT